MFQHVELHKDMFLPVSHPAYKRVVNVVNRLIESNKEIPLLQNKNWHVTVVSDPFVTNAFVLPVSLLIFPAHGAKILMFNAYTHNSSAGLLKHVGIPET
jgi:hypothetical protein